MGKVPYLRKLFNKHVFLIPFIALLIVLSINLNKPFIGHHDFMGVFEGMKARNYLKYGFWQLKFGQITGNFNGTVKYSSLDTHYLPLLPVLISLSFVIFGVVEWAERLIPALFSILGILAFLAVVERIWDRRIALISSIFYIFNPMFIYFGSLPAPDIPVLAMYLISFYFYLRWSLENKNWTFFLFCLSLFVGGLFSWTIVYIVPLLILHSAITGKLRLKLVIPCVVVFMTLSLQLIHSYILTGSFLTKDTLETLKSRLVEANFSFGGVQFTLYNYARLEISRLQAFFTRIALILSIICVISNLNLRFDRKKASLLFFLGVGIAHPLIFSRYVFVHDFLNFYLLPFISLSAALGLMILSHFLSRIGLNQKLIFFAVLTIVLVFAVERMKFTKALLATDFEKAGRNMGIILNSLQKSQSEAAIASPLFVSDYGIFISFYSNYPAAIISEESLVNGPQIQKFNYIITVDKYIENKVIYKQLIQKYSNEKIDNVTIFCIREQHCLPFSTQGFRI